MTVDSRSMATRFNLAGPLNPSDKEMYRRKLPLTPEARVNGTFCIEEGRKHSPKGLLPGKYSFWGPPERNEWPDGTVFWRSGGVGVFEDEANHIIDYEMFNISTFFAYESLQNLPNGSVVNIGNLTVDEREAHVNRVFNEKIFLEVITQHKSTYWEDYWPVEFKIISKAEFFVGYEEASHTSTFIEFERRIGTDATLC